MQAVIMLGEKVANSSFKVCHK